MQDKDYICAGQKIKCSMAAGPFTLMVIGTDVYKNKPIANIGDNKLGVNIIPPVCVCKSPANPVVASMIASTMGAVTQAPSAPLITAPWLPGNPQIIIRNMPVLTKNSKLICAYGGIISIQ